VGVNSSFTVSTLGAGVPTLTQTGVVASGEGSGPVSITLLNPQVLPAASFPKGTNNINSLLAGFVFIPGEDGQATLYGRPKEAGTYKLVFKATDARGKSTMQDFTLTVVKGAF
jgi:hypothetical protein